MVFVPKNVESRLVSPEDMRRFELMEETLRWTAIKLGLELGYWARRGKAMKEAAEELGKMRKITARLKELDEALEQGRIQLSSYLNEKKELMKQYKELQEKARTKMKPHIDAAKKINRYNRIVRDEILIPSLARLGYRVKKYDDVQEVPEWARKTIEAVKHKPQKPKK